MTSPTNRLFDFTGKPVVITGTSSGMGAAAMGLLIQAGAEVHAIDVQPTEGSAVDKTTGSAVRFHRADLGDPEAIDAVVEALPNRLEVLINCAGIPNGGRFSGEAVMRVNWLGLRQLTESLLPRMEDGGSVVHVASTAGRDWAERVSVHRELMDATTFDDGLKWMSANTGVYGDGYVVSKEAVQFYTLWRSVQLLSRGIRMNSVCPGITDTAIVGDFRKGMGTDIIDHAAAVAGRFAKPAEMAPAMLFLADNASSSYINGVNLNVDRGTGAARTTGQSDPDLIWSTTP